MNNPDFTENEEKILNAVQAPLPFVRRPFLVLEKELHIPEADVIRTVSELKDSGIIRNISGIFSGQKLGYRLSLVAAKVDDRNLERAAKVINSHPGVSHNYLRSHEYNVWFTLAEESEDDLQRSVRIIGEKAGAGDVLLMRNEKLIKIGVRFSIGGKGSGSAAGTGKPSGHGKDSMKAEPLTEEEKAAVILLQKDMPLTERPFRDLAEGSSMDEDTLIETAAGLEERGILRRYAGVLRHRKAGFGSNAMTAWKLPEGCSESVISPFEQEQAVTHLYLRTVWPGKWEYPLFAMIHGRSEDELTSIINGLARKSGLEDRLVLNSLKEFKKQRVMYFSPEFKKWKEQNYD